MLEEDCEVCGDFGVFWVDGGHAAAFETLDDFEAGVGLDEGFYLCGACFADLEELGWAQFTGESH